ncbi:glutathione reductase [Levilactobacillus zymae]|uniref:Glutathione reductase n=1 Tax=Levilactobacillus zymae TaxID=267363 RepID=A0ABQ0WZ71_9LACO|nr:NAD(P)/FAD-dependent oxidoreductase [Levilactobacillus zymae]QFR61793.1 NAD(P)/FAD-dependent oxidoreductase [Levilactobacillus zymae]GEO72860.1 glutathione reductase [Levilactobacillus zymae]
MTYDYDVLYIGGGHAAHDGAAPLAASGQRVAVVERDLMGGTCTNYGCNAKITLDEAVKLTRERARVGQIVDGPLTMNWAQSQAHKRAVIDPQPQELIDKLTSHGATVITGSARFKDAHTVTINGTRDVTAEKIVIATGLVPHRLAIPGSELAHDSRDFLDLDHLPAHLTIVGSGYISLEFATIANAAGAAVTILLHGDTVLRHFYQPYVQLVVADLKRRGVTFIANANVQAFTRDQTGYGVDYGDHQHLTTHWILDATGRVPHLDDLGLETVGVQFDRHGITVNDHLQTTVPNIYAAGDVIASDQPKLTPTATFESKYLTQLFTGQTSAPIDFPVIPSVVFTSPRIAQAGVTVNEAQQRGLSITHNDLETYWYYRIDREPLVKSTQIHDAQGHLVGVTEVSDQAPDVINTLLPAIEFQFNRDQINRLVGLFPTMGYAAWHRA